jgi:hypothetical protein
MLIQNALKIKKNVMEEYIKSRKRLKSYLKFIVKASKELLRFYGKVTGNFQPKKSIKLDQNLKDFSGYFASFD